MKIYENSTIRVTVSDEIVESLTERARYLSRLSSNQTEEQALRGIILSHAMSVIGNRSEATLLEAEIENDPIDPSEVHALACDILTREYLTEHTKYLAGETLQRLTAGMRMSEGMAHEAGMARAYARGALNPLTRDEIMMQMQENLDNRREIQKITLAATPNCDDGRRAIQLAHAVISERRANELHFRRARGASGWTIEVIGQLPNQIGVCRTTQFAQRN